MAANVVGSVRRRDRPEAVVLHIAGSRHALWSALRLIAVLILGLATIVIAFVLTRSDPWSKRLVGDEWRLMVWCCAGAAVLWWQVGRNVPRLLATALEHVTIRINVDELEVLTRRGPEGAALRTPWARSGIDDVLVTPRSGGAFELRIVPTVGRSTTLLHGLPKSELDFIAATMRDALRLTARDGSIEDCGEETIPDAAVAGVPALPLTGRSLAYAPAPGSLDYAAVPPEGVACERSPVGVTIEVPPLTAMSYAAHRWPLALLLFSVILIWGVAWGASREWVVVGAALAGLVAVSDAQACFTRTTVEVGRSKLTRTARTPFGVREESWPVHWVVAVNVIGHPPTVEMRLHGGEFVALAQTATADEAEDVAAALRVALRDAGRVRDGARDAN